MFMNSTKDKLENETPHFGNTLLGAVPSVVYNEDCVEGLKRFSDNHFDLAIVDPPYGIRRDGHSGVKAKKAEHNWKKYDFKGWDSERPNKNYWDELFRVSKNQIVFGANYFTEYLPPSMGWIFWDKGQELTMSDGELIFTSFEKAMRRKIINRASAREEGMIHPTQKPTLIYNFCLDYAKVKNGWRILDTHVGSGSSRIACQKRGLDFTGFEIDKDYYEAQEKRFKDFVSQLRMF